MCVRGASTGTSTGSECGRGGLPGAVVIPVAAAKPPDRSEIGPCLMGGDEKAEQRSAGTFAGRRPALLLGGADVVWPSYLHGVSCLQCGDLEAGRPQLREIAEKP
jgi:hypothetical protein